MYDIIVFVYSKEAMFCEMELQQKVDELENEIEQLKVKSSNEEGNEVSLSY